MNWKFWKTKKQPQRIVNLTTRERSQLRLSEFRSYDKLCAGVSIALGSEYMVIALDVLRNENIVNMMLPLNADQESRAAQQARCEGYILCLSNLESMAAAQETPKEINPTFQTEETEG